MTERDLSPVDAHLNKQSVHPDGQQQMFTPNLLQVIGRASAIYMPVQGERS